MGILYGLEGKAIAAEEEYRRSIALLEENFGASHPYYAKALTNLAVHLVQQGRREETETLLRRALALKEELLGPSHPSLIPTLNSLAGNASLLRNDHAEAERLYARALIIGERAYGKDHPHLLGVRNNLANTYHLQEKWAAAEEQFRFVLRGAQRLFAPDDLRLGLFHHNLAYVLQRQGNYEEAATEYEHALKIRGAGLPSNHPSLLKSKSHYAFVLHQLGRDEMAEEIEAEIKLVTELNDGPAPTLP